MLKLKKHSKQTIPKRVQKGRECSASRSNVDGGEAVVGGGGGGKSQSSWSDMPGSESNKQYKKPLHHQINHINIPFLFPSISFTYIIISNVFHMNKSNLSVRRSLTLDTDKQNRPKYLNLPLGGGKSSKRKPKLMSNNKIMQKLFPNFQTLDQERPEPVTFRKMDVGQDQEKMFRELFEQQRVKYQAILSRHMIMERPQRYEIKEFLGKEKHNTLQTYRF